jgi:AcrR family transcriptional regulator
MCPVLNPDSHTIDKDYEAKMSVLRAVNTMTETVDIDKMTVNSICEESHISRQTFYRYFNGKYDVLLWFFKNVITEYLGEIGVTLSWSEALSLLHRVAHRRATLAKSAYSSSFAESYIKDVAKIVSDILRTTIVDTKRLMVSPELEFQIIAWGWTFSHSVADWNKSGQKIPADAFSAYLASTVPSKLQKMLERYP